MYLAYDDYAENSWGYLKELSKMMEKTNKIDPELYDKYDVKRGLRNSNGTGVLVGLTGVGDVYGYRIENGVKIPDEGRLYYRGYEIMSIIDGFQKDERFGFEEVCYLLLFGELPDKNGLSLFNRLLGENRKLPDGFTEDMMLKAPSKDIMNKLARSILASYSYDSNPDDLSLQNILRQSIELIARFPTMVAYGYQAKARYYDQKSLFIHSPEFELSTAENLLYMIRPNCEYTKLEAELLDLALVLHAEHGGGNNSTFTARVVTTTGTDTYSAIAAAVGSLKGGKHGGANIKVLEMMENIKTNVKNWQDESQLIEYLDKIVAGKANDGSGLIYGMGHAIYTLSDPRALRLRKKAEELAKSKNIEDEFNLYATVERLAPEVLGKENISANVDFYSGFVYKALDIPKELFTPIFAVARISGWSAHRIEELVSKGKIIRPAYKNILEKQDYCFLKDRI
ncbi:MAG: citrate synthase [Firmicutes bacterium HGW-Firmicutes-12]|nr:MAG: citrate synthase [Firmicutes bacterium HGW-Firmicutes-12]